MPAALAIAAHPDDIEFLMAGTLLRLGEAGWDLHYLNLSRGNLGSTTLSPEETGRLRRAEAQAAAALLGATWHPPFCDDLAIFYTEENLRLLCAVIRQVRPSIVLTHALADYMEDHMSTARLAVTATFARGMPGYASLPPRPPAFTPCVLYHALPYGHLTPLREPVRPELLVDIGPVHERQRAALAAHASQKEWLDASQGQDSYLETMAAFSHGLGQQSGRFTHAEGWTRHLHYGFSTESDDPLSQVLGAACLRHS